MSKLYVSCIVVALLALAVMPALADPIQDTAEVTATVEPYGAISISAPGELTIPGGPGVQTAATTGWNEITSDASPPITTTSRGGFGDPAVPTYDPDNAGAAGIGVMIGEVNDACTLNIYGTPLTGDTSDKYIETWYQYGYSFAQMAGVWYSSYDTGWWPEIHPNAEEVIANLWSGGGEQPLRLGLELDPINEGWTTAGLLWGVKASNQMDLDDDGTYDDLAYADDYTGSMRVVLTWGL